MASINVHKAPIRTEKSCVRTTLRKFQNYFLDKEKIARPDGQSSHPDARDKDSIFDLIQSFLSP
jgi:hypothetical protein